MAQSQNQPSTIILDPEGDLMIRLYKTGQGGETFRNATSSFVPGRLIATLSALSSGNFVAGGQNTLDVKQGTAASLELWFRVFHGKMTEDMYSGDTIPIEEIWEAIQVSADWKFDVLKLKDWFAEFLSKPDNGLKDLDLDDMREWLYPCWKLDHIKGLQQLTRKFAYEGTEHITEHNPTDHRALHLPKSIVGAINAAKGNLRTKLIQALFNPVSSFLEQECSCKEMSLFAYCMALSNTGIWPLESHLKKSARSILESPGFVNFQCKIPEKCCMKCISQLHPHSVQESRKKICNSFKGLCIDCMNNSNTGDFDEDYWRHDSMKTWDARCRIKHGQATWYFSFMGRREDMKLYQERQKTQRKNNNRLTHRRR